MSNNIVHDDMASTSIVAAVAAATDHFAIIVGVEVLHIDSAKAIELDDLVGSMESASAVDVGGTAGLFESPASR